MDTTPPDVQEARNVRINSDISSFFRSHRTPISRHPPSFKGTGTYTHVETPHVRFDANDGYFDPPLEFLPRGGPNRTRRSTKVIAPTLPEPVAAAYQKLKAVLAEEEKLDWTAFSPGARFHALPVPGEASSTSTHVENNAEDAEMAGRDGVDGRSLIEDGTGAARDDSRKNSVQNASRKNIIENASRKNSIENASRKNSIEDASRKNSVENASRKNSVENASRKSSIAGSVGQPTPARQAHTPGADVTMGGTSVSGTIYDASRDPRRRGR